MIVKLNNLFICNNTFPYFFLEDNWRHYYNWCQENRNQDNRTMGAQGQTPRLWNISRRSLWSRPFGKDCWIQLQTVKIFVFLYRTRSTRFCGLTSTLITQCIQSYTTQSSLLWRRNKVKFVESMVTVKVPMITYPYILP